MMLAYASASNGYAGCFSTPPNLAGNHGNSTPGSDNTLFSKFQSAPSFSDQNRQDQRTYAALIVSIGQQRGFSDRDIAIAVATSLQESNLLNVPFRGALNDHTSLGLFQQQVSVGTYGTAEEILTPSHAINAFYDRLAGVKGRDQMSMMAVAIKVQIPNPVAYNRRWTAENWDALAPEIVAIYKQGGSALAPGGNSSGTVSNICAQNAGVTSTAGVHLPLDPGFHVAEGGAFAAIRDTGSSPHKGIDLIYGSHTLGRPVYAAFSGVVIYSGIGGGCNKINNNPVEIVSDNGGFQVDYLHMYGTDILVRKGDHVNAGEQIGKIGQCGQATGPHLHFEVTPRSDKDAWISTIPRVYMYGAYWLDPNAVMAHFGVTLIQQ